MELTRRVNDTLILTEDVSNKIVEFEKQLKAIEKQKKELREAILEEMEKNGIKKFEDETNGLTITYIEGTVRESFDNKRFRAEHSDLYDEYIKFSPVKSSVKISVKG